MRPPQKAGGNSPLAGRGYRRLVGNHREWCLESWLRGVIYNAHESGVAWQALDC